MSLSLIRVDLSRAHMKLTIKGLSVGDFGNYRCISKNSLGETEGSIRVYGEMRIHETLTLKVDLKCCKFHRNSTPGHTFKASDCC